MPDVLIRNVAAEDLAALDELARRLGLAQGEYLRRRLHQEASRVVVTVSVADLAALADTIPDLADDDVMSNAWS